MPTSDAASVFSRLALSVRSPDSSDAYGNDSFGYVARALRGDPQNFSQDDEIVLLGRNNAVSHAILVRYGSIIADRQSDFLKIPSDYDSSSGVYTTRFSSRSKNQIFLETVQRKSVSDFRIEHGFSQPFSPPASSFG